MDWLVLLWSNSPLGTVRWMFPVRDGVVYRGDIYTSCVVKIYVTIQMVWYVVLWLEVVTSALFFAKKCIKDPQNRLPNGPVE